MLLDDIVCKTSVALDAQRAVHNCIKTPTFLYAELALQLFSGQHQDQLLGPLLELSALPREEFACGEHVEKHCSTPEEEPE